MGYCGTTGCRSAFGTAGGYVGCERTVPVAMLPCEDIRTTGTRTDRQRRQLLDRHAAVLVQLLRHAADVDPDQRLGRDELQHHQPEHHQLLRQHQLHEPDDRRLLGAPPPVDAAASTPRPSARRRTGATSSSGTPPSTRAAPRSRRARRAEGRAGRHRDVLRRTPRPAARPTTRGSARRPASRAAPGPPALQYSCNTAPPASTGWC